MGIKAAPVTANDIGAMRRFGANVIVFVLNNSGYLIERALQKSPNWTYNDLAAWNYAELPMALGCADWFTARVITLGELDDAMKSARATKSGAYIEIMGGKMDMPPASPMAAEGHVRRHAIMRLVRQKMASSGAVAICELDRRRGTSATVSHLALIGLRPPLGSLHQYGMKPQRSGSSKTLPVS
jgi:hypothetical protein